MQKRKKQTNTQLNYSNAIRNEASTRSWIGLVILDIPLCKAKIIQSQILLHIHKDPDTR